jgi:hypothetical protein
MRYFFTLIAITYGVVLYHAIDSYRIYLAKQELSATITKLTNPATDPDSTGAAIDNYIKQQQQLLGMQPKGK